MLSTAKAGIARGERFEKEYRIVRSDGIVRWIHSWTNVEKDASGRPIRLLGTCQDVTESRLAEQEVDVRASSSSWSWIRRPRSSPTTTAIGAWSGPTRATRIGSARSQSRVVASVCERVLAGETVDIEMEVLYPTVGRRSIQMVAAPTRDASGAPDGCVAVITDVTRRR